MNNLEPIKQSISSLNNQIIKPQISSINKIKKDILQETGINVSVKNIKNQTIFISVNSGAEASELRLKKQVILNKLVKYKNIQISIG